MQMAMKSSVFLSPYLEMNAPPAIPPMMLIVVLMVISGGLAGLAGIIQVVGVEGRMDAGISAGYGFTAIVVALLGRLDAFGVLLAAILIAFLDVGGQAMSIDNGLPYSIVLAIQGVFVLFVVVADRFGRAR